MDEMGSNTSLYPLCACSSVGNRASCSVPRNRGKNTTLVASMSTTGMGPSMAIEGSMDAPVFETYIERFLVPSLKPGQVVVMDNLGTHKGERVRELLEEAGCELMYLPTYSPDLNPIEEAFSKVKAILRKAEACARDILIETLGKAISAVSSQDSRGFFKHCGYRAASQASDAFDVLSSTAMLCSESSSVRQSVITIFLLQRRSEE